MKALSNSDKPKAFIVPKITDLITFLDNNRKYAVYKVVIIHVLCRYLEIVGAPTTLTNSVQRYHYFDPSSSINNDTENLHPDISYLRMRQKIIFKCFGRIVHKSDACIILGPKFLPPILRIKMSKFKFLNSEEPN